LIPPFQILKIGYHIESRLLTRFTYSVQHFTVGRFKQAEGLSFVIGDFALFIDNYNAAGRATREPGFHIIQFGDFAIRVGKKAQRKLVFLGETFVRLYRIGGDTHDLSPGRLIFRPMIPDGAKLGGAHRCIVTRIEKQDYVLAAVVLKCPIVTVPVF
jgi:hypothetical protein